MKNIVILGLPRSGKTTLARMIKDKFSKYQIITGDAVRNTFIEGISRIEHISNTKIKRYLPQFLSMLFNEEIRHNKSSFLYILDTCDITPKQANKLFDKTRDNLIFLGYPSITFEDKWRDIKKYETNEDWTNRKEQKQVIKEIKEAVEKSKIFEKQCQELNIRFIDTSFNREKILKKLLEELTE